MAKSVFGVCGAHCMSTQNGSGPWRGETSTCVIHCTTLQPFINLILEKLFYQNLLCFNSHAFCARNYFYLSARRDNKLIEQISFFLRIFIQVDFRIFFFIISTNLLQLCAPPTSFHVQCLRNILCYWLLRRQKWKNNLPFHKQLHASSKRVLARNILISLRVTSRFMSCDCWDFVIQSGRIRESGSERVSLPQDIFNIHGSWLFSKKRFSK